MLLIWIRRQPLIVKYIFAAAIVFSPGLFMLLASGTSVVRSLVTYLAIVVAAGFIFLVLGLRGERAAVSRSSADAPSP